MQIIVEFLGLEYFIFIYFKRARINFFINFAIFYTENGLHTGNNGRCSEGTEKEFARNDKKGGKREGGTSLD